MTVGIKLYVADAGDPAPAVGVVHSGAGPVRHIPETGKPAVGVRLFLAAGQTDQQHGGLSTGSGSGQVTAGVLGEQMQHRQGIGPAGSIPGLGAGHGDGADEKHHRAQRG